IQRPGVCGTEADALLRLGQRIQRHIRPCERCRIAEQTLQARIILVIVLFGIAAIPAIMLMPELHFRNDETAVRPQGVHKGELVETEPTDRFAERRLHLAHIRGGETGLHEFPSDFQRCNHDAPSNASRAPKAQVKWDRRKQSVMRYTSQIFWKTNQYMPNDNENPSCRGAVVQYSDR